MINKKQR